MPQLVNIRIEKLCIFRKALPAVGSPLTAGKLGLRPVQRKTEGDVAVVAAAAAEAGAAEAAGHTEAGRC